MNLQESTEIQCPYCGELITILVDCSAGPQRYIEDCQVCCRPILLQVTFSEEGYLQVEAHRDDE